MSLIDKLNKLEGKTPDEIADALRKPREVVMNISLSDLLQNDGAMRSMLRQMMNLNPVIQEATREHRRLAEWPRWEITGRDRSRTGRSDPPPHQLRSPRA